MDINQPITLDREDMFCEKGIALATDVIEKTRRALKNAFSPYSSGAFEAEDVKAAIIRLYAHAGQCDDCQKN
jgi:hypothetical protein